MAEMSNDKVTYVLYEGLNVVAEYDDVKDAVRDAREMHLRNPSAYHEVYKRVGSSSFFGVFQLKAHDDIDGIPRGEYEYDWVLLIDWNNGRQGYTLVRDTPHAKDMFDNIGRILRSSPYNIDVFLTRVTRHKTIEP